MLDPVTEPPFDPARAARLRSVENERCSGVTALPPMRAMARRFSGLIEAKPRRDLAFVSILPNFSDGHALSQTQQNTDAKVSRTKSQKTMVD